jgi:Cu+-exporting ATPase
MRVETALESTVEAMKAPAAAGVAGKACFHCGEPCPDNRFARDDHTFCCQGCQFVHDLLAESGLAQFYDLSRHPGVKVRQSTKTEKWAYLDEQALQQRLLDFTDGKVSRITLRIPAIHCVACVWLLENLFRLHPGIGKSQVNFPRREVAVSFAPGQIKLSELAALLASIGYEPQLTLGELEQKRRDPLRQRQWLQVGVAGFAFGNIMLISLPLYLGLDTLNGPLFQRVFGWLSLALAIPVLAYSASDYWKSAWLSIRQRVLTLDVPIALGLVALYAQSAYEILSGSGEGYLDSLTGLIFFLLCGRAFQQMTHERMAFDRDYKCFFPLSAVRKTSAGEEPVAISNLKVGDRLLLRHGELIPADCRLVGGAGFIDYSFVTGESEPVSKEPGDYLYAGGQQIGGGIEVETVKPVSQSYLTSLWNHDAFQKDSGHDLNTLTNRYSRRFTRIVIAVALLGGTFWLLSGDAARGIKAFTSVLIVACPCALALAAPFTLGTAQRLLARLGIFVKNALVIERMAQVNAIVFDKTGTLTTSGGRTVTFHAAGGGTLTGTLSRDEARRVCALARHSTHPHAQRIASCLGSESAPASTESFSETAGFGIEGRVEGREIWLGSRAMLGKYGVAVPSMDLPPGSVVYLAVQGEFRGAFVLANVLRPETDRLLGELGRTCELALLSGDNEKEREKFRALFGVQSRLHFNQSPLEKLGFIRRLQDSGRVVMMVGDGLNDAGALKQSDVGVAVVEKVGAFSPASDVIMAADQVCRAHRVLEFGRRAARIVRVSFGISAVYNLVGISIAAAGILSPLICAILMPLSSISVVLFACGATAWAARKTGMTTEQPVRQ